mgnify:FL=1
MSKQELDRVRIIQRVLDKQLSQRAAAEMLGIGPRQVRRCCRAMQRDGPAGLVSLRRGKRSNRRLPDRVRDEAVAIVRERYPDFGPTFAHEKLTEKHAMTMSVETLRSWMIAGGLWSSRTQRRPTAQQPRRRRPCRGELVQIDGSDHEWFEERAERCTLLVFIDDATSELMELRFVESESAFSYFAALRGYVQQHGRPVALYSDKAAVFRVTRQEAAGGAGETQFARALKELDVSIIFANSPAAKGRVERANLTLQDRLVKELRLASISDMASGNAWLPTYVADHNRRFACAPMDVNDAHRALRDEDDLDRILTWRETRKVTKNLTLRFRCVLYLLDKTDAAYQAAGRRIDVDEHEDGAVAFWFRGRQLAATAFPKEHATRQADVVDNKRLDAALRWAKQLQKQRLDERLAKPQTTKREARLLANGTRRRVETPQFNAAAG